MMEDLFLLNVLLMLTFMNTIMSNKYCENLFNELKSAN